MPWARWFSPVDGGKISSLTGFAVLASLMGRANLPGR